MNDKAQLAAMGEHLAEQPMCLQKRVDQLEALLREARDMMDNQPRGFSDMMLRIDEALDGAMATQPAAPEGWQLVPVKLTFKMWDAMNAGYQSPACQWDAALAAAPKPGDADA